jgi:hypothetical protein
MACLLFLALASGAVHAEPYLAVQRGFQCGQCHVNPTGGGLRNSFGNAFVQTQLAARRVDTGDQLWTGELNRFLSLGGDVRANATFRDVPHQQSVNEFDLQEARVYLGVAAIPDRLVVYVDERLAPDESEAMEAYARYWTENRRWYVQAGKMYLPFGLRLEDDSAFTRQVPNIDMTTPDNGVEVGWESGAWSAQFAVSNGTQGAAEVDDGKQYSLQAVYVTGRWRLGAAGNVNSRDVGDRNAYALFGGVKTGPIAWLAEADLVTDESFPEGKRDLVAGLLEANWLIRQGHNLKLTAEYGDFNRDVSSDELQRYSLLYEYTPVQFVQVRAGVRFNEGPSSDDFQNRTTYFVQLHGFF